MNFVLFARRPLDGRVVPPALDSMPDPGRICPTARTTTFCAGELGESVAEHFAHYFPLDTAVSLAATAAPGSVFAGWAGGGCSGTGACQLSLLDDAEVNATFTPITVSAPTGPPSPPNPGRCLVPKLEGKKLKAAKKIIRRADCRIGTVKKPKGATAKTGKVKKQSPKAGTVLAPRAKVDVKLGG